MNYDTCPKCENTGWLHLLRGGRMKRMRPCTCEIGRGRAEAIAQFVRENEDDEFLEEHEL